MVLPRSPDLDDTLRNPHTSLAEFHLLEGDKVIDEVAVTDFTVSIDSKAAQLRSLRLTMSGEDDNIPATIAGKLAPGGSRARAFRGARIQNIVTVGGPKASASAWTPTTEYGVLNGTVAEADGAITLGWTD